MLITLPLFISGAEIAFVIFILVMVFGADKIPEIARGLGQGMRVVKNATNDIKTEVTKSADKHMKDMGVDDFKNLDVSKDIKKEVDKVSEDIEDVTGPIKRRF